jgi:glycerol uptake facilitator protein
VVGGAAYQVLIHPFLPARRRALREQREAAQTEVGREPA